ncbi:MAG: LexA family transcriptional regulator [Deltaproteobacteria bacterium]|jgi:transcriptional regulator with XRE-family HTH domain|nr:LexA family transcriptional regulator [Deltaproteobacteria bacterium]
MKTIDKIFSESLKYFVQQERSQRSFAAKVGISAPYLNDLLNGRRYGEDQTKRKIASALGYPDRRYEDFLDIGRIILNGNSVPESDKYSGLGDEALRIRGFLPLNFSEQLVLGPDNFIQITDDVRKSHVVIHGPSLRRSTSIGLQAFKAPDDSMEPLIAKGGVVVADLTQNSPESLKEGQIYIVCLEKETGQCTVKYLGWAEKNKAILVCSENRKHKTMVRRLEDLLIVGRVIWSSRTF